MPAWTGPPVKPERESDVQPATTNGRTLRAQCAAQDPVHPAGTLAL